MIQEALDTYGNMSAKEAGCPNCGSTSPMETFFEVSNVPVHSVLLMPTREFAMEYPRADIRLAFCQHCTFVSNVAFDASAHSYSPRYEETQGFSPTFQAFHRTLAELLIEKYNVRGKHVLEIGCGKGEFLSLLCEMGQNTGVGIDPAFVPERNPAASSLNVEFIQDFYTEAYASYATDVICCKMTLEHIPDTQTFIQTVRDSVGLREDTLVFFQIPDFDRILRDNAFWDVYYEHCSYFTEASLKHLFERCGFETISIETQYDNQYLQIFCRPAKKNESLFDLDMATIANAHSALHQFGESVKASIKEWRQLLEEAATQKAKVVLWGSGSKAVAFLSAMQGSGKIEFVVDINPYRHDHFLPGTGQMIVAPDFLTDYKPDLVIAMNSIYCREIEQMLKQAACSCRLLAL
jgi:SAM-dependent methyltransferase